MKILITDVSELGTQTRVLFECDSGRGGAAWTGTPPTVGEYRFIELELASPLVIGRDMIETDEPTGLRIDDSRCILVGEVTQIGDDGYVHLEFGCGGVDLEVTGNQPTVHRRYRVAAGELKAFDCDY